MFGLDGSGDGAGETQGNLFLSGILMDLNLIRGLSKRNLLCAILGNHYGVTKSKGSVSQPRLQDF